MIQAPLRVLVADALESDELTPLHEAGIEVVERSGIGPEELAKELPGFAGLLVRSRTRVTKELLALCPGLRVVGRAGTGVDNIDLDAATRAGVVVMNTPGGNAVAAAEHTLALLFAMCRHIAPAAESLRAGNWEPKRFQGIELSEKTLGIVGLGRIGREVAKRAQALRMKVVGYDPLITPEVSEELGIPTLSLADLAAGSDVVTVHVPHTEKTHHLIGRDFLARCRPNVRILNVARGGVLDEDALQEALAEGRVAGAALDVFEKEPPTNRDLLAHPRVLATPHLGASTIEAQRGVAREIAQQVGRFLTVGVAENAVNLVGMSPDSLEELRPWTVLCERLGALAEGLLTGPPRTVEITIFGDVARHPRSAFKLPILAGLLKPYAGDRVNQVNAALFAEEQGLRVSDQARESHKSFHSLVRLRVANEQDSVSVSGTLFGRQHLRVVRAHGFNIDAIPEGPMIFCANEDRPGVIAHLGSVLARRGVNIANMSVGRDEAKGRALAVLNVDGELTQDVLQELGRGPGVRSIHYVTLPAAGA